MRPVNSLQGRSSRCATSATLTSGGGGMPSPEAASLLQPAATASEDRLSRPSAQRRTTWRTGRGGRSCRLLLAFLVGESLCSSGVRGGGDRFRRKRWHRQPPANRFVRLPVGKRGANLAADVQGAGPLATSVPAVLAVADRRGD